MLPFFFTRHSTFSTLCSRLVYFLVPFLAHCLSFFARDRSSVLSLSCARKASCFLRASRVTPHFSLLRHPTSVVGHPDSNAAEIAPSNIVHLAPLTSCRPEYFSLPLAATPVPPSPVRTNGGSGRSWKWEPAHVWAPLCRASPVRYRRVDSTTSRYECTYNGCHPDGFQPSVARSCAWLRQSGIDYSFPRITLQTASRCRWAGTVFCVEKYVGDSFSRQTLENRWIRRSRLISAKRCDIPSRNIFLYVKASRRFGYKYRGKSIGCSFGREPCSPSKLLLEIIDGACISSVSLVSQNFLSRSFFFNTCLSIANHIYFKAVVYFKERDGENSVERFSLSLSDYNNIQYMSVMFIFAFIISSTMRKVLSWTYPAIFKKM